MSNGDARSPLVRADENAEQQQFKVEHPLNERSEIWIRPISRIAGLERTGVNWTRVPAGKEAFVHHAHHREEEWVYVLAGRGIAEIGDDEHEIGPGDFLGYRAPGVSHHLRNPFDEDLICLMGGEACPVEIADFPRHGKRLVRDESSFYLVDVADLKPFARED